MTIIITCSELVTIPWWITSEMLLFCIDSFAIGTQSGDTFLWALMTMTVNMF